MTRCSTAEILRITPGPSMRTPLGEFEVRWCFRCRKRLRHERVVLEDPFPSYYEPLKVLALRGLRWRLHHVSRASPVTRCSTCWERQR